MRWNDLKLLRHWFQNNPVEIEEQYKELCDSANDLIDMLSTDGKVLYANAAWRHTLKYSTAEVAGLYLWDVVHPDDLPHAREGLRRVAAGEPPRRFEVRFRAKDGSTVYLEGTATCRRVRGKPIIIRGILRDISERRRAEQELREAQQRLQAALIREQELARIDSLTQVSNRRAFYEFAETELARARRYQRPLSIAYLDLDNFKRINDTLGHATGDAVLVSVASTLRGQLRATDVIARLGGDEFAVLLPETNAASARVVLEKLQAGLRETVAANHWKVTFSIGAASFLVPPALLETAIRLADETMYSVKNQGKNGVAVAVIG